MTAPGDRPVSVPAGDLHGLPDAAGLVDAVRQFLEEEVLEATEGRIRFHTRVAMNVLDIVVRELRLGPGLEEAHRRALDGLGVASEAELAAKIRSGEVDDRLDEVKAAVIETVRAKLLVSNPAHLGGP